MKKCKKILGLILAVVMVTACLAACGGPSPEQQAEKAVDSCFTALKSGDTQTATSYMKDSNITDTDDDSEDAAINETMTKAVFGKLEYKILSSQKMDDSTVTVKVEITNVDMKPVFTEFFTQALQYALENAFADPQPTEEEMDQKMTEIFDTCLSKEGLATVTKEVDVKVIMDGEKWIIDSDEGLANALLGGLGDAMEELEDSFSSLG